MFALGKIQTVGFGVRSFARCTVLHGADRTLVCALICVSTLLVVKEAVADQASCSKPTIVSRSEWSAAPPVMNRMTLQAAKAIVIHHTGVKSHPHLSLEKKLRDLQRYAMAPGSEDGRPKRALGDVPYHFFIGFDGRIGEGRGLEFAGDTRTNYDTSDKIQIVVEGDFTTEQPQAQQLEALQRLLCWLRRKYAIAKSEVRTHRDVADTSCPGENLLSAWREMNRQ